MSLAERLKPTGHKTDKVLAIYEALNDADREALRGALLERRGNGYVFSGGDVARALQAEGHAIVDTQVSHLRRKILEGRVEL